MILKMGMKILILERGDYLPKEKENWDPLNFKLIKKDTLLYQLQEIIPFIKNNLVNLS